MGWFEIGVVVALVLIYLQGEANAHSVKHNNLISDAFERNVNESLERLECKSDKILSKIETID